MNFKGIALSDKALIESYYKTENNDTSYYNFANLYIWRSFEEIEYSVFNEMLIVRGRLSESGLRYYLYPMGKGSAKDVIEQIIKIDDGFVLSAITKDQAQELNDFFGDRISIDRNRSMDNYVYNTEDLINLNGKKLHAKRNHINKFNSLYAWEYHAMNKKYAEECKEVLEAWCVSKNCDEDDAMIYEKNAVSDVIDNYEALGLKGCLIKANGQIVAFAVGELIGNDTALIHIEKADTNFQGAYAVINREFVANEFSKTRYINREDDFGMEGLRKAKLSYNPVFLKEFYNASFKAER